MAVAVAICQTRSCDVTVTEKRPMTVMRGEILSSNNHYQGSIQCSGGGQTPQLLPQTFKLLLYACSNL